MRFRMFVISACVLLATTPIVAEPLVIKLCVSQTTGDVRLPIGGSCSPGRSLVIWTFETPPGLQGPVGPQGIPGIAGPQGLTGPTGNAGSPGPAGPAGPSGAVGPAGATGEAGSIGSIGAAGPMGATGNDGLTGQTGATGAAGPQGATGGEGPAGTTGAVGPAGATGNDGLNGATGPQGAAGADGYNGPRVVDANGLEVGILTDPMNGTVVRKVGDDAVWFTAPASGLAPGPINFFHSTPDCSGERYLQIMGGQGLVFFGYVHSGAIFYTKTLDPSFDVAVDVHAYEHFEAGQDATLRGTCVPWEGGTHSLGVVTTAVDPAVARFVAPLRVR